MRKKQTAVSHSSTESVVISIGAGLRMDGSSALDLWDLVIEVLHPSTKVELAQRDLVRKERDGNAGCCVGVCKDENMTRTNFLTKRKWSGDTVESP